MENTERLRKWVLGGLGAGMLVSLLLGMLLTGERMLLNGDWGGLLLNLCTELAGALATYGLLTLFIGRREKKVELIAQMGSRANNVAVAAAEELGRCGWLYDGSLRGANLNGANLQGANLKEANLREVRLEGAKLQGAFLYKANLQGANLHGARLQEARLQEANLQDTFLVYVSLEGADLCAANLQGAYMAGAKLERANLHGIVGSSLDGTTTRRYTILPDGMKWTPGTDMTRFTDFTRPDCWRPDRYS